MTLDLRVDALTAAIARYNAPEIVNTDQGSQFTSKAWADVLDRSCVRVSMDGKGRRIDNVFIERLWHSVKCEDIYLQAYEDGRELHAGLVRYFDFYNRRRIHQALDYQTPDEIHFCGTLNLPQAIAA